MTLMLHAGANALTYDDLRAVQTPVGTDTHVPIPHHELVQLVRYTLGFFGHEITEEARAVTPDGGRYFGLMSLRSPYGDYVDTLGLRNSHDKSFPIGIAFGSRVFVCDNLAFNADIVIKRKHTLKARRELPGLVTEIVQPLQAQRIAQNERLLTYKGAALADAAADQAIMQMYRKDVIGVQAIGHVLKAYEEPPHDWGDKRLGDCSMLQPLPSLARWRRSLTSPSSCTMSSTTLVRGCTNHSPATRRGFSFACVDKSFSRSLCLRLSVLHFYDRRVRELLKVVRLIVRGQVVATEEIQVNSVSTILPLFDDHTWPLC